MVEKRRLTLAVSLLAVLVLVAGCTQAPAATSEVTPSTVQAAPTGVQATPTPPPLAATATPTAVVPTPTATVLLPVTGGTATSAPTLSLSGQLLREARACNLVNSQDLAELFPPHNEIVRDTPKTSAVSHPPFSDASAAGTETQCTFYDFHQPGVITGWMLQVTTLVDAPDASQIQTWSQAWAQAKAKSGQPVSGLGEDAFASAGNLFIKVGDAYIAFESIDTHLDNQSSAGQKQLLAYNEQLAKDGLSQFQ